MLKGEKKCIEFIYRYKNILFFLSISLLGACIRYVGKDFISKDMTNFLIPWYDEISEKGGIHSLGEQVGDYNILYQTIIAFMTYFKGNSVYYYKIFSVIFDYILSFLAAWLVTDALKEKKFGITFNLVYMAVLMMPTVVLNSAYWGQCDSIYTCFMVVTLFLLFREKYIPAFIFLGAGFAFKFQMIFIMPFIFCYYIYKRRFSITLLFLSVITFWFSGIIAFFNGRNLLDPFIIYLHQTDTYQQMYMNTVNFWPLLGNDYQNLKLFAIVITIALCGAGLYCCMSNRKTIDTQEDVFAVACWFAWTCVFFLPAMHERYSYPVDIMLIILTCMNRKYLKYAVLSCTLSLITYGSFLFDNGSAEKWFSVFALIGWAGFTYCVWKRTQIDFINEDGNNK